jgi:transposase InsO family protein
MLLHGNARLSPFQRQLVCERVRLEGWTVEEAADAAGCSQRTVYRWLARHDAGEAMTDKSSAPHRRPTRTPARVEAQIERLRRLRFTSTRIAATLEMAVSTVCAVLKRLGLNRLWKLGPPEPPNRYCRRHAGDLVHVDVKKLGRFHRPGHRRLGRGPGRADKRHMGWEAVHVCIDDATRLAYVEILPDERATTTVGFFERAVAWFAARGVRVRQVLSDNGAPYKSDLWALWCSTHRIEHLRTRPYRPQTNGKAERFIQTMLREWAYAATYRTSAHRARALPAWIDYYNHQRPHGALSHKTPASRLHAD